MVAFGNMVFFESAEMLDLGASDNGNVFNLTRHFEKKRAPNRADKATLLRVLRIILGRVCLAYQIS